MVGDRPRVIRAILVVLLLGGAYLAVQPWLDCAFALGRWNPDMARMCTFGFGISGFGPPRWPSLVVAAIYIGAAVWTVVTSRIDFAAGDAGKP